jgi:hypothetical protein
MTSKSPLLPRWLWLWFPLGFVVFEFLFHAVRPEIYRPIYRGENGVTETLTVVFLLAGIGIAVRLFMRRREAGSRWFAPWMLLLAAGCLVFAGEEISWGQHWALFEVPEEIAARNDQGEFNLHNDPLLEPVFDFWARNALSWGALVGGVILPIIRRRAGYGALDPRAPSLWNWFVPSMTCVPTAAMVCLVTLPPRVFGLRGIPTPYPFPWDISWSETKEFYISLLLLIYLLALARSFRR